MTFSTKTKRFAYSLVATYAKFSEDLKAFDLDYQDIPDFDQHELSAYIMADSPDLAMEATSVDNPIYGKTMLPALHHFMMDTTVRDREVEFSRAWRDGIVNYFIPIIKSLIDDSLELYNNDNFRKQVG